jgi:hypothetical protein
MEGAEFSCPFNEILGLATHSVLTSSSCGHYEERLHPFTLLAHYTLTALDLIYVARFIARGATKVDILILGGVAGLYNFLRM